MRIGLIIWIVRSPAPAIAPAASPISYGRQIAPLFAFHCVGCHGVSNPSSNLRVTQFAALRAGGDIGDEIVPGHPEKSILMDFIEGKRGPRQRMPQNSRPLSPGQIAVIRRWISEGAEKDNAEAPCFDLQIGRVPASSSEPIQIRARITTSAFVIMSVRDPLSGRELYVDDGSIKTPREAANLARPGEWISRALTREGDWPSVISLSLRIQYASAVPRDSVLIASTHQGGEQRTSKLLRTVCGPL
jgi:mono/diheme cytochrome c family protein